MPRQRTTKTKAIDDAVSRLGDLVGPARDRLGEVVGRLMVEGAAVKRQGFGMGTIEVPVDRVRAIILALVELAHVLALGDPDGNGRPVVERLARIVRRDMGDEIASVVRAAIAHGATCACNVDTAADVASRASAGGPVGEA